MLLDEAPDLAYLIGLRLMRIGLQVEQFGNTRPLEYVVAASDVHGEAQTTQHEAEIVEPDGRIMPAIQDSQQDTTPAHRLTRSGRPHAAGQRRRTPYRVHASRCPKAPPA